MKFEPVRTIGGMRYVYYDSYSSKKYAGLKAKFVLKGRPGQFVIRKLYIESKPYALFIHHGEKK